MKPPPFVYHRPTDLDEAMEVLTEVGADGKVLAGGQSLVPLMSMRLAAPEHVVDINGLTGLGGVRAGHDGVRVGALVRHAELERDEAAHRVVPLLRQALTHVAHPTIRNRGTTVGSLAHADPAGEMTGVLALLGGSVRVRGATTERLIHADEFFIGTLESAIGPDELAIEAFFPAPPARTGSAWLEVSRRNGDYAVCGVGALVTLDADRRISSGRVALISVGSVPVVVDVTEALAAQAADGADFAAAGRLVDAGIDPQPDIHAGADYRRHLATVLTERAVRQAAKHASEEVASD